MIPKPKPKYQPSLFTDRPQPFEIFKVPEYPRGLRCDSSSQAYETFKDFEHAATEYFLCIFMNPKNEVLSVRYQTGTLDSAQVYPRQIALHAIQAQATHLIIMHNHPTGDPDPSLCDREIKRSLFKMAHVLEVKLLDHIIIGRNQFFSFSDHGLMADYESELGGVIMATFKAQGPDLYIDGRKVLKAWESFSGWYWFATENIQEQESDLGNGVGGPDTIWFGLVQGFDEEWGDFSEAEIKSLGNRAWPIKKCDLPHAGRR